MINLCIVHTIALYCGLAPAPPHLQRSAWHDWASTAVRTSRHQLIGCVSTLHFAQLLAASLERHWELIKTVEQCWVSTPLKFVHKLYAVESICCTNVCHRKALASIGGVPSSKITVNCLFVSPRLSLPLFSLSTNQQTTKGCQL